MTSAVNGPVTPSASTHADAADRGGRVIRLAVELLDETGHHEQQREHDGGEHDHDHEADEPVPEVAHGQQDHERADQPVRVAHSVTVRSMPV